MIQILVKLSWYGDPVKTKLAHVILHSLHLQQTLNIPNFESTSERIL